MKNRNRALSSLVLAIILICSGCSVGIADTGYVAAENVVEMMTYESSEVIGSGIMDSERNEADSELTEEQTELVLSYMDCYYQSLSTLSLVSMSHLFSTNAAYDVNVAALEFQIKLRLIQDADYSLDYYYYTVYPQSITQLDSDTVRIIIMEDTDMRFAQTSDVLTQQKNIQHVFDLNREIDGHLYIESHMMIDVICGELEIYLGEEWSNDRANEYIAASEEYLSEIERYSEERSLDAGLTRESLSADYPYDSAAALEYSVSYFNTRNPEWVDYSIYGGNCQNFVSQCVFAGGIPMDTKGSAIWMWYGDQATTRGSKNGRSYSWSSVPYFVEYVRNNEDYGLCAEDDIPFFTGIVGDLAVLGTEDAWNHVVIISDTVTDELGQTLDYLVNSNTRDLLNYPVTLYGYPDIMLIGIYGWNS